ncbi:MAG: type 1 glutamine amidotransferase [Acidobacteria bacterium]|nr:type 1 glutamine amidotransferase [Acidobacteriota bacterium]
MAARALVVQHLEVEGPYAIAGALAAAGVEVVVYRADLDGAPPALDGFGALVVMGGPMAAYSDDGFPTRRAELDLLAEAVREGIPTLGVCLGAQLLAHATGGRARPGTGLEIGWGPIILTEEAGSDPLLAGCPRDQVVVHWHGDTYDPPPGAVRLASSPRYPEQAFRAGERAWGLQFHIEMTPEAVERWFPGDVGEPDSGGVVAGAPGALAALAPVRAAVLGRFAELVATGPGR